MKHYPPPRYKPPETEAPDAAKIPELLRQARAAVDEAESAIAERDHSTATERLRRLEEIAVFARYLVLATR